MHAGSLEVAPEENGWSFSLPVYLGDLPAGAVGAQLYAEPVAGEPPTVVPMQPAGPVPGAINGVMCRARVATQRPHTDFTVRLVPQHPHAKVPLETSRILWIER